MYSVYKNKKSIVLQNSRVRAEFIPEPGGKMVSLINRDTNFEYLVQRTNPVYLDQPFDGKYVNGECSGYDDMFPTIDECYYEMEPWKGIKMADHGEVWSLDWDYEMKEDSVKMTVAGKRFPYELEKEISFINENTIRIQYKLVNKSIHDFEFLWAGHFMLNLQEGTKLVVPDDCKEAITILTNTSRKVGDINYWPNFTDKAGNFYRVDISRSKEADGFEKYYFNNKLKDGWCELMYPDSKNKIKISFPVDTVPYLGILMNENGWDNLYNIFIEPCTVCYDRPDIAKQHGQVSSVKGLGEYKWHIDITI